MIREPALPLQHGVPEEWLHTIYAALPCGVIVRSASGQVITANDAARRILGASLDALRRGKQPTFLRPDGTELPREELPGLVALRTGNAQCNVVVGFDRPDGRRRYLQVDAVPVQWDGRSATHVIISLTDVTEHLETEEALRRSEEGFRLLFAQSPQPMWVYDLHTLYFLEVNDAAIAHYGYTRDEFLSMRITDIRPPTQVGALQELVNRRPVGLRRSGCWQHTLKDGRVIDVEVTGHTLAFAGREAVLVLAQDITERRRAEEALQHLALHDTLTGLPNRTLLNDRLRQGLLAVQRDHEPLALLLLDLDRFKEINDSLGHDYGDILVQQVAQRLQGALRATDTVARLGGDEFAVLLPCDDLNGTMVAVGKITRALDAPFVVEKQSLHVSSSIGIAMYPDHGRDAATLLRQAEVAMYVAKRRREHYAVYASELDDNSPDRLALITDLRHAIAERKLTLCYQPKVALGAGNLGGVEALLRWPHPRLGLIPPNQFIPLAEAMGLMAPLTQWVLEAALRQCRTWRRMGFPISIAVNLSTANLLDRHLPDTIADLLRAHDLPADALRIEVTESTIMADTALAQDVLSRLAALGVGVSVDDFGTGYSSLAYLKRLPLDELKIDRSFVSHMAKDEADAAIVASTIGLGHNLGLRVVAEGVENQETWDALALLQCDMAQGFHMSRPLPPDELEPWLRRAFPR